MIKKRNIASYKPLPTKHKERVLQKMEFRNALDEFEYAEMMVDTYYELKPEYQQLVTLYQEHGEHLRIEEYMIDQKKIKKQRDLYEYVPGDDLPF